MERNHLWNFGRVHHEEQFCEIILNLGQWFSRCCLKNFLSGALAVLLFGAAELFMHFWKSASWRTFMWSYMKFGLVVQEEMSFKDISYLELWQPLSSVDWNHFHYWKKAPWGTIPWNYFEFGPVAQEEMPFKGISYHELWQPFCSTKRNDLCNFGRGYQEEQFCEIILSLSQLFRRCCLKDSYLELWRPSCSREQNHLCNFERGHHGKHSYEVIWN